MAHLPKWPACWLLLALLWSCAAELASAQAASATSEQERGLYVRLRAYDHELGHLQRDTRLYLGTWIVTNSALAAAQLGIAFGTHSAVVRNNYFVGAGLSGAGLVMLLAQRWPGLGAQREFQALPEVTLDEKHAKLARAEQLLSAQRAHDKAAGSITRHLIASAVALGSGVRAGLSFDSVEQGLGRAAFVLTVLELQILTRPGHYLFPRTDTRRAARTVQQPAASLALLPWLERRAPGLSIHARF